VESLLFLAHRLPYPPHKGDKVRSYHFLRHLAARYRVHLGTFVDDPADWQHVEAVRQMCAALYVEPLVPWLKRATSSRALLSGEPVTLPYFRSRALQHWVRQTVREAHISRAFVFSSAMAQYVLDLPQLRAVVDFVDMDSQKWADYALRRKWPASAFFRREAQRLQAFERAAGQRADATLFVTDEEAQRFLAHAPECAPRVLTVRNGVDSDYFSPEAAGASPFAEDEQAIVFTGAMDYWPNVDAVVWFAREVLPVLRQRHPVRFYVVGMNPDITVRTLANVPGIVVTGRVPDVRPYLQHAKVVVAPLRVARGIQNKVLEAMAMARPVVATPACAGGLSARAGVELEVAADPKGFAAKVHALMDPARARAMGELARERVLHDYAWRASFELLDPLLEPAVDIAAEAVAV
jgi:sugar transferase (PEP-CTERM/EpsH1 system associated)